MILDSDCAVTLAAIGGCVSFQAASHSRTITATITAQEAVELSRQLIKAAREAWSQSQLTVDLEQSEVVLIVGKSPDKD